ncbi:hypothetical protein ACFLT7_07475 [candidate division KSB1 bacterium]
MRIVPVAGLVSFLLAAVFATVGAADTTSDFPSDIPLKYEEPDDPPPPPPEPPALKVKTRSYNLGTSFLVNELVQGGSFSLKSEKEWFVGAESVGWSDNLKIAYEHTEISPGYMVLLEDTKLGKRKERFQFEYHLSYKSKPFIDITYCSDQKILEHSTYLVGGMGKQFSNGVKVEGGAGMKMSNTDLTQDNYEVFNVTVGYQTPKTLKAFKIDTKVKSYLPRKYMASNRLDGSWMIDAESKLTFSKKIFGISPTIGFNIRRDFLSVQRNDQPALQELVRYNLTLGFNFKGGGKVVGG